MFDYCKLLGRITEKVGTRRNFANKIGISERSLCLKLQGKICFKQWEIMKACEILDINISDIALYFFTVKVQHI